MWRLVSWERHFEDGTSQRDPRTESYIIYTETGHMCFVAMDPDRPEWNSSGAPTAEEALSAIAGFATYCGTVEVNLEERYVVHHVEMELRPNSVGVSRRRFFEFTGPDQIVLTVDPAELRPPVVASTVVWERVVR